MASNPGYDPSGKARRLADGIYVLSQKMGGRVHAFLIDDNGSLTLIDTLFDTDGARVLAAIALFAVLAGFDALLSAALGDGSKPY